jgi:hypothetical protein
MKSKNITKTLPALLLLSLALTACLGGAKKGETVKRAEKIYGNEIVFPQGGEWRVIARADEVLSDGVASEEDVQYILRDTEAELPAAGPYLVVYYSAQDCVPCKLKELGGWSSAARKISAAAGEEGLPIVFILAARPDDAEIEEVLLRQSLRYPLLFDTADEFARNNILPENELYHTFLIDNTGRIALAGSPIYNPQLLEVYCRMVAGFYPYAG